MMLCKDAAIAIDFTYVDIEVSIYNIYLICKVLYILQSNSNTKTSDPIQKPAFKIDALSKSPLFLNPML